jgi:hypothetical protein
VSSWVRALLILSLTGCDPQVDPDSAFYRFKKIAKVTRGWLGVEPAVRQMAQVEKSVVDSFEGRLRRRLDLVLQGVFSDAEIKSELLKRLGEKNFTQRIHVGVMLMWQSEDRQRPMAIGVYARDAKGWLGAPCDHLRIAGRGDQEFTALMDEVMAR